MLETWEIRWFGRGAIPLTLQQWSEENNFTAHPVRKDYYLLNVSELHLGVKYREGAMQIKELIDSDEYEHYKKWSFNIDDDGSQLKMVQEREEWIGVSKKREMGKWKVGDSEIKRIGPENEEDNYVEVELSAIMCQKKLWWSLAFEATGGQTVLEKALKEINFPELKGAEKMGYAEWLKKNFNNGS